MNDDYLWDGSGEPDPEVQRLEQVLSRYRYEARPLSSKLRSHFGWNRHRPVAFAAAAAVVLMVLTGVLVFKHQQRSETNRQVLNATATEPVERTPPPKEVNPDTATNKATPGTIALERGSQRKPPHRRVFKEQAPPDPSHRVDSDLIAGRQPILIPFINLQTARHLEQAQLMLRSFRNMRESNSEMDWALAYETQQSRGLLYKNIVLRRDAEARGNLPAENLLSTLEPFLLDIANLPDKPTAEEVRSIKERIQEKEIVSVLQIYSAPVLSQAL